MDAIQTIPLSKLKPSTQNVRKSGGKNIDTLVASIAAHGLRQNLTVIEAGKGFEVVAGGRRLRALQQLAKASKLPGQLIDGIPCMVVDASEAQEISLAENTIREAMSPIDQFAAFQAMADAGAGTADIAARFGVSELVVKQRMRLARISPKLLKVYGDGGMTLEQLQAFAVSDDPAQQEGLWKRLQGGSDYYQRPEQIRSELARSEVGTGDPRVQLVGLPAYEAAGGQLRRDLFTDAVFVLDVPLLESLVAPALQQAAEIVRAEGWSWVEIGTERPAWNAPKIEGEDAGLSPEEYAEANALDDANRVLTLAEQIRLDQLQDPVYTAEQKAIAGARVLLAHNGVVVCRGLLRDGQAAPETDDEDEEDEGHAGDGRDDDDDGPIGTTRNATPKPTEKDPAAIPQRLVFDLTLRRTGELRVAMTREPEKAITVLTAALAEQWRRNYPYGTQAIGISLKNGPDAGDAFGAVAEVWKKRLAFSGPVLDWLLVQPGSMVDDLLAFLVAESLDIVKRYPNQGKLGDDLCAYFDVDLADHWRPDAEFLQAMPAAAIHAALEPHLTDAALSRAKKMKKAELAGYAAEILAPTRWVPACVQLPVASKADPKPKKARGKAAAAGDA